MVFCIGMDIQLISKNGLQTSFYEFFSQKAKATKIQTNEQQIFEGVIRIEPYEVGKEFEFSFWTYDEKDYNPDSLVLVDFFNANTNSSVKNSSFVRIDKRGKFTSYKTTFIPGFELIHVVLTFKKAENSLTYIGSFAVNPIESEANKSPIEYQFLKFTNVKSDFSQLNSLGDYLWGIKNANSLEYSIQKHPLVVPNLLQSANFDESINHNKSSFFACYIGQGNYEIEFSDPESSEPIHTSPVVSPSGDLFVGISVARSGAILIIDGVSQPFKTQHRSLGWDRKGNRVDFVAFNIKITDRKPSS